MTHIAPKSEKKQGMLGLELIQLSWQSAGRWQS